MPNPLQSGVIPAAVMPFHSDASPDWGTFDNYIEELAEGGSSAIAVNMAAAEVTTLEPEEQFEAVRRARRVVGGSIPVVAGLVHASTQGAATLGKRLVDAGAQALVVFPPLPTFSSKPIRPEVIVDHHAAITQAAGVPIIAFNTGNATYPRGTINALAKVPGIVAIKDAAFNIELSAEMVDEAAETNGRIVVLTGNDTFILEALLLGSPGALIGYAGTATAELVAMQNHAAAGRVTEAYEIWGRLGPLARFIWSAPLRDYRPRMKYALMRQGVIPNTVTRAPQPGLDPADQVIMDRLFDRYGYADARYRPRGK